MTPEQEQTLLEHYRDLSDSSMRGNAFQELYNAFEKRVWTYCRIALGDSVVAEDVAHTVLIRLFHSGTKPLSKRTMKFDPTAELSLPADDVLREFLPEFTEAWLKDLEQNYLAICDRKSSAELYRMGHTIKGSCMQFGLKEMAPLGYDVMDISKEEDWDSARELYPFIVQAFEKLDELVKG